MNLETILVEAFNKFSSLQLQNKAGALNGKKDIISAAMNAGYQKLVVRMKAASNPGDVVHLIGENPIDDKDPGVTMSIPVRKGPSKKKPRLDSLPEDVAEKVEPITNELPELTLVSISELDSAGLAEYGTDALKAFAEDSGLSVDSRWKNPEKIAAFIKSELNKQV